MKNRTSLIKILPIFIISLLILALGHLNSVNTPEADAIFKYKGYVCVYAKHNGIWQKIGCNHNILVNSGKDMILDRLAHGNLDNITYIAVANNTVAQSESDTSLQGEWTTCGLSRTQANEFTKNDIGNWSIAYTWTVTCDNVIVNATGLYNSTGTLFAETTIPTHTFYDGDNLRVEWQISVS